MFINEIYSCIQGEGRLVGVPSVLVRTSGCNLKCKWCDTPFTSINPQGEHMQGVDILDAIRDSANGIINHVIISGGEPTIQKELSGIVSCLTLLGYHVTIETNGTIYPTDVDSKTLISISPKLSNSGNKNHKPPLDILSLILKDYDSYLKFVVCNKYDLVEIQELLNNLYPKISNDRVYLMPEGQTKAEIDKKRKWLVEICKETGYNFGTRLHVDIYGKKRKV